LTPSLCPDWQLLQLPSIALPRKFGPTSYIKRASLSMEVVWDGRDGKGGHVPSGVYVIRLEAGGKAFARKVVLVR